VRLSGRVGLRETMIAGSGDCRLSAFFGKPKTKPKSALKLAILVHGFAAEKTENGLFLEVAKKLLAQGIFVLSYDWRGLGNSEGDFSVSSLDTHVRDFQAVVRWAIRNVRVSESEICALGFSLGSAVVAKTIRSGQKIGGAALWSPATRPSVSMWPRYNTEEIRGELERTGFVLKSESNVRLGKPILDSLRDTDLGDDAFDLGIPLLVCHGSGDVRIPVQCTRQSFEHIREKMIGQVRYVEFSGASHSFRPEKQYRPRLLSFLSKWLTDEVFRSQPSLWETFPPNTSPATLPRSS